MSEPSKAFGKHIWTCFRRISRFHFMTPNGEFTRKTRTTAAYIASTAKITGSLVNEGCMVYGKVDHSVLFYGVHVGEGSVIKDSVIMPIRPNRE